MIEVEIRRSKSGGRRRAASVVSTGWTRHNQTPLAKARYLADRDGATRAREFAYARMKDHEPGSDSADFWHDVWKLLRAGPGALKR